jgi:hypothetical protein
MMNNRNNPPEPPEWNDPSHIPHFPDWPNVPYADWPRTRFHRWNDSEPANVQPWWQDCCEPFDDPCICVTSADAELWNSYSSLSGLTGFEPETISAAVSSYSAISAQLEQFSGWDDLKYGYDVLSANSGMWNSAGYVPGILSAISALDAKKLDASGVHVWTDSEKLAHDAGAYGNFSGTIVGVGTYERPLRLSPYAIKAISIVDQATDGYKTGLVNTDTASAMIRDIDTLNDNMADLAGSVSGNRKLIEWILNHMGEMGMSAMWENKKVTLEESEANPAIFYYWDETDPPNN